MSRELSKFRHPRNVPQAILDQTGEHLFQRFGGSLAYDTRNSTQLPNHGQRTEIDPELSLGDTTYYKIEVKTAWYFPGLFKGHVIEAVGRAGIANSLSRRRAFLRPLLSWRRFTRCAVSNSATSRRANRVLPA